MRPGMRRCRPVAAAGRFLAAPFGHRRGSRGPVGGSGILGHDQGGAGAHGKDHGENGKRFGHDSKEVSETACRFGENLSSASEKSVRRVTIDRG